MTDDHYDIEILKRSHKSHIKQLKMDSFTNGYETGFSDAKKYYFIILAFHSEL